MISVNWRIWAALGILTLVVTAFFSYGHSRYKAGQQEEKQNEIKVQQSTQKKQDKITKVIVTKYIPEVHTITLKGQTIYKKVPVYVTKEDDTRCVIPNSFVQLWNDSNSMQVPNSTSRIDGTASAVVLSDVEAQHTTESTINSLNATKLQNLQEWVRKEMAVQ